MQSTDCKENWMESLSLGISSWRKERKFGLIWRLGKPNLNLSYLSSEEDLIRLPKLLIWMKSVLASTFPLLGSVGDILRNVSSHDMLSILYSLPFSPCHLGPPAPSSLSLWVGANERKVGSWLDNPPNPPLHTHTVVSSVDMISWKHLGLWLGHPNLDLKIVTRNITNSIQDQLPAVLKLILGFYNKKMCRSLIQGLDAKGKMKLNQFETALSLNICKTLSRT